MCVIGSEIDFSEPIFVCMLVALICAMCAWIETYYDKIKRPPALSRPTRGAWIEIHDDIQRRHGEGGRAFVEHAD